MGAFAGPIGVAGQVLGAGASIFGQARSARAEARAREEQGLLSLEDALQEAKIARTEAGEKARESFAALEGAAARAGAGGGVGSLGTYGPAAIGNIAATSANALRIGRARSDRLAKEADFSFRAARGVRRAAPFGIGETILSTAFNLSRTPAAFRFRRGD